MEKNALIPKNMDDLVFENRHRAYGAYAVRKSYSGNMNRAFLSCVSLAVALITINQVFALFGESPLPPLPKPLTGIIDINTDPPIVIPIKKPEAPPPPRINSTAPVAPVVTTQETPELTPVNNENTASVGTDDGTGDETNADFFGEGNSSEDNGVATAPPPTAIMDFVQVMPQFKGGEKEMLKFFQRKTKYPGTSRRLGIDGTVLVQFVVRADSTITDVVVIRGISADCDKEAARVVASMPKWEPGIQNKQAVNVRRVVPIKFVLDR
jgi:protein TonB